MTTWNDAVRSVVVDDRRVAYVEAGDGYPVLLVHGNFASKRWYRELLEAPPAGLRLVAIDLPNFGDSDPLGAPISIAAYADAVRGTTRALELHASVLVGHSLGGNVVMHAVGDDPHAFAGVLLVDSGPPDGLTTPEAHYALLEAFRGDAALLAQALGPMMPTRVPSDMNALVADALRMHPDAFSGNARALADLDLGPALAAFVGPVRVLRGGHDVLIDADMAARTVAAFRGSRDAELLTWPDVGHSPIVEAPERFGALVAAVVDRVREGPTA